MALWHYDTKKLQQFHVESGVDNAINVMLSYWVRQTRHTRVEIEETTVYKNEEKQNDTCYYCTY